MRTLGLQSAIIAALVSVTAPAIADIDTDMSRAHITALSGQQGDGVETARSDTIYYVQVRERGDKPCYLTVAPQSVYHLVVSQCGRDPSDTWTVDVPDHRTVTGIQPCYNRRSGRLKGMRIFYDDNPTESVVAEIQPNCRGNRANWDDRIDCPDGQGGFGIRAHFTELPGNRANPIIGVQLICGQID